MVAILSLVFRSVACVCGSWRRSGLSHAVSLLLLLHGASCLLPVADAARIENPASTVSFDEALTSTIDSQVLTSAGTLARTHTTITHAVPHTTTTHAVQMPEPLLNMSITTEQIVHGREVFALDDILGHSLPPPPPGPMSWLYVERFDAFELYGYLSIFMLAYMAFMFHYARKEHGNLAPLTRLRLFSALMLALFDLGSDIVYLATQPFYSAWNAFFALIFIILPAIGYLVVSVRPGQGKEEGGRLEILIFFDSMDGLFCDLRYFSYHVNKRALRFLQKAIKSQGEYFFMCLIINSITHVFRHVFMLFIHLLIVVIMLAAPIAMLIFYIVAINLKVPIFEQAWKIYKRRFTLDHIQVSVWMCGGEPRYGCRPPDKDYNTLKKWYRALNLLNQIDNPEDGKHSGVTVDWTEILPVYSHEEGTFRPGLLSTEIKKMEKIDEETLLEFLKKIPAEPFKPKPKIPAEPKPKMQKADSGIPRNKKENHAIMSFDSSGEKWLMVGEERPLVDKEDELWDDTLVKALKQATQPTEVALPQEVELDPDVWNACEISRRKLKLPKAHFIKVGDTYFRPGVPCSSREIAKCKDVNYSFLTEVCFESIPQLIASTINSNLVLDDDAKIYKNSVYVLSAQCPSNTTNLLGTIARACAVQGTSHA